MFLHPSTCILFFTIISSILIILTVNSWFLIWLALEINLLVFLPLIITKKRKYSSESALKYFLVQVVRSIIIILVTSLTLNNNFRENLVIIAALLKIGAAPIHQWVISIIEGISWQTTTLLLTLQKLNPLTILSYIFIENSFIIYCFIIFSAVLGSIGALNQTSLRKIIVYSSINHLAWLIISMQISSKLLYLYYSIYIIILITVTRLIYLLQINTVRQILQNKSKYIWVLIISFLSLGGLPPFTGFVPKIIILQELNRLHQVFILIILLFTRFLALFFYMRVILTSSINFSNSNFFYKKNKYVLLIILNIILTILPPFILLILNFKLYKLDTFKV